jgi:hypothetical protein
MGAFSSDRSVQDYADGIWSGKSFVNQLERLLIL